MTASSSGSSGASSSGQLSSSSSSSSSSSGAGSSSGAFANRCSALAAPTGTTVMVTPAQADQLPQLVSQAASGTTLLLADGTYRMTGGSESARRISFTTPGITLRGASGNAAAVILDGEYITQEMIFVGAENTTITDVTVTRAVDHGIHISPVTTGVNVTGTRIHRVALVDHGEQFIKGNPNSGRDAFVDTGTISCSAFVMTDDGRPHVERSPGGCYTGGIDLHSAQGWVVEHNRFEGLYCAGEGLAEHAVHFWSGGRDTLVQNNVIVNCARGIGFGLVESGASRTYADNPCPGANGGYVGHFDGMIRNNVLWANLPWYDTGIELDQACGARVHHNTLVHGAGATGFFSSIDYRFGNTSVEVRNNLVARITVRNGASGTVDHNVEDADLNWLADPSNGDMHLSANASTAIDQGVAVVGAGLDMDGQMHSNGPPDVGADER